MVLNKHIFKSAVFLLSGLACHMSFADSGVVKGIFKYRVTNSNCPVKFKSGKRYIVYKKKLPVGTIAIGKPAPQSNDLILFKTSETRELLLAARKSCLFQTTEKSKASEEVVDVSVNRRTNLTLGTFHWQENVSVDYQNIQTQIRSTTVAIGLTLQKMKVREKSERGMHYQVIYGKSQLALAAEPNDSSNIQEFGVSNVDVAAFIAAPTYLIRPSSGDIAFGIQLPLMLRYALLPLPANIASEASIGPKLKFLTGLFLESRFERGNFIFTQKVGFLNIPKSLTWGLDAGWRF